MKHSDIASELLQDSVLNPVDAARLALEIQEGLRHRGSRCSRTVLLNRMRRVIQAGLKAIQQEERTVNLKTAAWASIKARESYLRPVSLRDLRYYVRRILRVDGAERLMLRSAKSSDCRRILYSAFGESKNAYVKGRAILHSIFAYGIRCEWCDANPVSRLEVPRVQEKLIEPLTNEDVCKLQAAARGSDMQLSLNLMLFSGIRPAEVARLSPNDICWKERLVIIRSQTSKTGGGRVVPLRGCQRIPAARRIIPHNWARRWRALRHKAGFSEWVPDVCRHTFATYHAAHFKNLQTLQLEMGHHDLNLLRCRYLRPASSVAARQFWKNVGERKSGTS